MSALLDLFTLLIFLTVLLGFYAARAFSKKKRYEELVEARLATLNDETSSTAVISTEQDDSILQTEVRWFFSKWPWIGRKADLWMLNIDAFGWMPTLKLRLLVVFFVAVILGVLVGRRSSSPMLIGWLSSMLFFVGIGVWCYRAKLKKYLEQLQQSLPEAIDSITRTARAGVPVQSAFGIVAEHTKGPLSKEFKLIDHWLKLGVPLRRALMDSAARMPIAEYRFFAVILIINQETGGRLGDTLERLSHTLRARSEMKLKVMSKTSEARASAKIVAALVPAVMIYMYVNAPNDFTFLLTDSVGIKVFIYAVCSVSLGLFITHMMVRKVA